jgi:hypothetical protein
MAFTSEEKALMVKMGVGNVDAIGLDQQLAAYSAHITEEIEDEVSAEIVRWTGGTMKGTVTATATESNRGFNLGSVNSADTSNPKTNIEKLLFFETTSAYQVALERG